jgi:hypothetical protein
MKYFDGTEGPGARRVRAMTSVGQYEERRSADLVRSRFYPSSNVSQKTTAICVVDIA